MRSPSISVTAQPWCVQVVLKATKLPAVGWVTTTPAPSLMNPLPTGTSAVLASASAAGSSAGGAVVSVLGSAGVVGSPAGVVGSAGGALGSVVADGAASGSSPAPQAARSPGDADGAHAHERGAAPDAAATGHVPVAVMGAGAGQSGCRVVLIHRSPLRVCQVAAGPVNGPAALSTTAAGGSSPPAAAVAHTRLVRSGPPGWICRRDRLV